MTNEREQVTRRRAMAVAASGMLVSSSPSSLLRQLLGSSGSPP
ncbi:hypothetical protein [Actinophytocola oryzae]|nr:hypothetical protein [Actinophytocola oryzae]